MNFGELWNLFFINPILNVLVLFYKLFEFLKIPGPMGFAVIAMTLVIRLVLYPLMKSQMVSARKMSNLKPKIDELNAKHKDNKQALQQAQLNLYKEHGVNPAAGCLPLLVQMPVLIALYNVFYQVLGNGDLTKLIESVNKVVYFPFLKLTTLDLSFFGISLGVKPSEWQKYGWWLLLVPIITGLLQYWQTKLMMPNTSESRIKNLESGKDNKIIKKDEKPETDSAAEMQKQMALISPIMFAVFAYQFPFGLALYWNIFGLFGIMQQMKINKEHGN